MSVVMVPREAPDWLMNAMVSAAQAESPNVEGRVGYVQIRAAWDTAIAMLSAASSPEGGEPVDETQGILNVAHRMAARMGAELVVDPAKVAAFRATQRDFAPAPKGEAASEASLWQAHDRREAAPYEPEAADCPRCAGRGGDCPECCNGFVLTSSPGPAVDRGAGVVVPRASLGTIMEWYQTLPKGARERISLANLHDLSKALSAPPPSVGEGVRERVAAFLKDRDEALAGDAPDDGERLASAEAILALAPGLLARPDRAAELGDFISALFEWGSDDPHDQADHIRKFLVGDLGLEAYRDEALCPDAGATPQPDFDYFECPECGFSSVQPAAFKGSDTCPHCAGDCGRDVGMKRRTCLSTDRPEGKDARVLRPDAGGA